MRIAEDLGAFAFWGGFGGPDLGPTKKEPLFGRKSVDQRRFRFGFQRVHQCRVGDIQTSEIGDILAEGQLSVDVQTSQNLIAVKLVYDARGPLVKILPVLGRPPRIEIAFGVILAALVVEAVRDLVTDDGSHSAVINGVVRCKIIVWRLQNAGRECDVIARRRILRVDGWRSKSP